MDVSCKAEPCPVILDCSCVFYSGANLIYTGINTNDNFCSALQKIDNKFKDAGLGYIFGNGIIQYTPGGMVQLGGNLLTNTLISSQGFDFTISKNVISGAHVTIGGTSSQFVKGDGSLDNTAYQPVGNYITALTGDGFATGPGVSTFTLDQVSAIYAGTWGDATHIPQFTLDSKGRILSVTSVPVTVPPGPLVFVGDVFGSGLVGSPVTLTLSNVLSTPGTYGSISQIPVVTVNAKGLVTGISQVPFTAGSGTVTSVGVTAGTGISASVTNPTTTPNITITNTAPDQTVVLNNGTGISVTGTYPNFTISATGTSGVSAVTASSPLFSSGGATPNITIQQSSGSQDGYLSSTDWTTFNNKVGGSGTATRIAFWDTGSTITSSSNLYWDNVNNRLGVGTSSPAYGVDVTGTIRATTTGYFGSEQVRISTSTSGYTEYRDASERKFLVGDGSTDVAQIRVYNGNYLKIINDITSVNIADLTQITSALTFTSGTNAHNSLLINPSLNLTGGTTYYRGLYYNPVKTAVTGLTEIAWENTSGDIIHGNLAGGGTQMVTVDNTGKLGATTIPTGGGGLLHGTASGTDTYTTTITGPTSYADGDAYLIRFTNGNTGTATLNINGLGAVTLYRNNDGPVLGGDIVAGGEMLCVYDGTTSHFQVIGVAPNTLLGYVTNGESIAITKGQPVYAFSGTGDRMVVKLAYNTTDTTSAQTVGLVMSSSIGANQKGLIMMQGLLDGLSTLPTSTYTDGDAVYLGTTAGSITNVKQYAPNHLVYLGVVTTASPGAAGRMYVRVQNGYELDELHNVQAQSPTVNDVLYYFGGSPGQWKTASISTVLGYTPVGGTGTTNELAYFTAASTIGSLTTATYPSLTELSYVKGVTSAIQTQIDGKQADSAWVNANSQSISGWSATTTKLIQYKLLGNKTAILQWEIVGTGSGSSASLTLPFTSSAWGNQYSNYHAQQSTSAIGVCVVGASSTTLTFYPTATVPSNFTNGQARNLRGQMIINLT